jgi:hypothetical protein
MFAPKPIEIEFEQIRRIDHDKWPEDYLKKPVPGNLYMLPGVIGKSGGLLCLNKQGEYLVLSAGQIFSDLPIEWPDKSLDIHLKIEGDVIRIYPNK